MEVEPSQPSSTVFEPGLCKPVPTSATSTISNKSVYSETTPTPSQDKQGVEEEGDVTELVELKGFESHLEQAMSKISSLQHIFQALMIGSQVHWAEDPDMEQLMISLGTPPDI
uniref:Centromere protein H C-terminal domain-containing protein n=1 Tax=Branchiostoma floridae TaxID=7739 RepID=C3YVL8_BRAFL|eukprot:XP_002599729.1 hypothetical protein BRAFLDRAFT_105167 [Branchiostoma floridae]